MHGIQTWGLSFVGADGSTELCFGPPQNSFQFQLTTRSSFLFVFLLSSTNFTRKNCLLKQDSNSSRRSRRREWWPLDHHVGHPNNDIFMRKRKWWQKNDSKMTETIEIEWFYLKRRLLDQTLFSLSPIRLNGHLLTAYLRPHSLLVCFHFYFYMYKPTSIFDSKIVQFLPQINVTNKLEIDNIRCRDLNSRLSRKWVSTRPVANLKHAPLASIMFANFLLTINWKPLHLSKIVSWRF